MPKIPSNPDGDGTVPGQALEDASTPPARWYFDPDHHRKELERVFARTWQHVARSEQLDSPGDYVTSEIGDERLLMVRGADAHLRAFSNVCRHRAGVVAQGEGCAKAFRCTYHGWTYGLQGELMAAPEMEGVRGFAPDRFGLPPLRCEEWGPYVFVNLDREAPPLLETIGSLPRRAAGLFLERMVFGGRKTYEIACNWKVYVDNYLEGYHLPRAHPDLNKVLDYGRYVVEPDGQLVTQSAPYRVQAAPKIDGSEGSLYVWLYPNFMLNVSPDYAQTNLIVPLAPEKTLCIFDYYFHPGPTGADVGVSAHAKSMAWADSIQQEDIWICETVQRNLRSRFYSTGRYSAKRENGLYHFHELLRRALA